MAPIHLTTDSIHIWLFWEEPQKAKLVKEYLRSLVEKCGFKNGTKGGAQNKVVEVFPKNDQTAEGKPGNLIALPFARRSLPLNDELKPVSLDEFKVPDLANYYNANVADLFTPPDPAKKEKKQPNKATKKLSKKTSFNLVESALEFIGADDYDTWIKVGFALKSEFGDEGFETWDGWSSSSSKYEGYEKTSRQWNGFERDGGITISTLFHLAKESGWTPAHMLKGESEQPVIMVKGGYLHEEVDAAEAALLKSEIGIYQQNNRLVRVVRLPKNSVEAEIKRASGVSVVRDVISAWLREKLGIVAVWGKEGKYEPTRIDPPTTHAAALLAREGEWKAPVLTGIVSTPVFRHDMSLIQTPGHDPKTGLLYEPNGADFPPVAEAPGKEEALAALDILKAPFREFVFSDEADKSVLLAAILTSLVRRICPSAPLFAIDAPTAGSGKSLLVELVGIIATGHKPAMMSQGKNPEEDEKRISSVLMSGDSILVIDNCDRPLGGDTLCTILTQEVFRARILGKSETPELLTNVLVMATGNNLSIEGDLGRRTLVCRIDTGEERPDEIEHSFDAVEEVTNFRPKLVTAALTILRAYHLSEDKVKLSPMGSFEMWNMVREALVWLGCADPADTRHRIIADDPKKVELAELLKLWRQAFEDEAVTVAEIDSYAAQDRGGLKFQLREYLAKMTYKGDFNTKSIGRLLSRHKDRVVGGLVLRTHDDRSKAKRYWVQSIQTKESTHCPF